MIKESWPLNVTEPFLDDGLRIASETCRTGIVIDRCVGDSTLLVLLLSQRTYCISSCQWVEPKPKFGKKWDKAEQRTKAGWDEGGPRTNSIITMRTAGSTPAWYTRHVEPTRSRSRIEPKDAPLSTLYQGQTMPNDRLLPVTSRNECQWERALALRRIGHCLVKRCSEQHATVGISSYTSRRNRRWQKNPNSWPISSILAYYFKYTCNMCTPLLELNDVKPIFLSSNMLKQGGFRFKSTLL